MIQDTDITPAPGGDGESLSGTTALAGCEDLSAAVDALRTEVVSMAKVVRQQLEKSVQGLLHDNLDLCNGVIADDELVDQYDKSVNEIAMETLVQYHPVGDELRLVVTSINIARSLERLADHAVTIARRSRKIMKKGGLDEVGLIEPLFTMAVGQLMEALSAYVDRDAERAGRLAGRDRDLDKAYKKITKGLSKMLELRHEGCAGLVHLLFVARALERVGDLAVSIAEDVVYIESAEDIRHSLAS